MARITLQSLKEAMMVFDDLVLDREEIGVQHDAVSLGR